MTFDNDLPGAAKHHEHALALDPINLDVLSDADLLPLHLGRVDESPALNGDASAALTAMKQETSKEWCLIALPLAYHALGRQSDREAALSELIGKYEKSAPYNIAHVYANCRGADKEFEQLNTAVQYRDGGISGIGAQPLFARIRSDSRWLPFLRRVGKAPEQGGKIEFKVTLPKEWQSRG